MPQFGSDENGFNAFSKRYKENPSIAHYLKLRREHPEAEIEISVSGGIDHLFFMQSELQRFGIDPQLVASVLDANSEAISEISLLLLEKLVQRDLALKSGRHTFYEEASQFLTNWSIG